MAEISNAKLSNAKHTDEENDSMRKKREKGKRIQIVIFISSQSERGLVYSFSGIGKSRVCRI